MFGLSVESVVDDILYTIGYLAAFMFRRTTLLS